VRLVIVALAAVAALAAAIVLWPAHDKPLPYGGLNPCAAPLAGAGRYTCQGTRLIAPR
jgi:hypothetical protein